MFDDNFCIIKSYQTFCFFMIKTCNFSSPKRNVQEKDMNQNHLTKTKTGVLLNKFNPCGFNTDFPLVRDNDYEPPNEILKSAKIACNL